MRGKKKKKNAQSQPQIHGRLDQKSAETVLPKESSPPRNQLKSSQFTHRKESSQPISNANHLTSIWHISRQTEFCLAVSEQALEDNRGPTLQNMCERLFMFLAPLFTVFLMFHWRTEKG